VPTADSRPFTGDFAKHSDNCDGVWIWWRANLAARTECEQGYLSAYLPPSIRAIRFQAPLLFDPVSSPSTFWAYFGYPRAHEHDAERAVQAGLAIVEATPKLATAVGATVHVRVGIATGIVVVGDLLASGESQERGVVVETPNLAARLQGIAQPDSVVIAEGTRKLPSTSGALRAYVALRESSQESRFEAVHAGGLTALVGREEESELLLRRFAEAKAGDGQVVLLSGEAGIGKSRLTAALLERLTDEPHVRMRYFCSPARRQRPLSNHRSLCSTS
jgi:hypothetical protein